MSDFNFASNTDNLGSNPDYNFASDLIWQITEWGILAGSNITLSTAGDAVTINSTASGGGSALGLLGGTDITLSTAGDVITINSTASGGGGSSLGLIGGDNISLGTAGDVVTINADSNLLDSNASGQISTLTQATPEAADHFIFEDATDSNNKKRCIASALGVSHAHDASLITSGTFDNTRIAESNVTQHQAALTITQSQISDLSTWGILGGSNITLSTTGDVVTINSTASGSALGLNAGTGISLGTTGDVVTITNSITSLANLTDVDSSVSSPSDGDILVYRSAGSDWVLEAKPAGGSSPAIADITDITITTVADNEVLAYDTGTGEWINQTAAEAGLAAASHAHDASLITSGTFDNTRIAESNVTQHQAALTITESQISDLSHTQLGLQASTGISLGTVGDVVTITNTAPDTTFGILGGTDITLSTAGDVVTINSTASGGGGSTSEINYVSNFNFETDATGWAAYADAAATTPADGTGGTPTSTFTRTTSTPLRGTGSGLFSKPASNEQGEGFSYDFTIDEADKGELLSITADIDFTGSADDMVLYVYDVTNTNLISVGDPLIDPASARISTTFLTSASSTSYRLIFHVATTSATAYTLKIDNVKIGPEISSSTPAKVLLDTRVASSSGTIEFTNIDGTYRNYIIELENVVPVTDDVGLYLRTSADGGVTWDTTSSYSHAGFMAYSTSNVSIMGRSVTQIQLTYVGGTVGLSNVAAEGGASGDIELFNPSDTTKYTRVKSSLACNLSAASGDIVGITDTSGFRLSTAAVNAIQFSMSSGNIASGTFRLYGIQDVAEDSNLKPLGKHEVFVTGGNGHGSTNNKIRRFTTTVKNIGTAISYTDSATDGASFTINEAGIYAIHYVDGTTGTGYPYTGVSLNSSELTTDIELITNADRLVSVNDGSARHSIIASTTVYLASGDVIRPHTDGTPNHTPDEEVSFRIVKVSSPLTSSGTTIAGTVAQHEVYLAGDNGRGSTNTCIRRFTTTVIDTGDAITYTDSATDGASFTINTTGLYSLSMAGYYVPTLNYMGFSVNSSQLTTDIQTITQANRLLVALSGNDSSYGTVNVSGVVYLNAGDVVRPHTETNSAAATGAALNWCRITKVNNN